MSEVFYLFVLGAWVVFGVVLVVWIHLSHQYMTSLNRYRELLDKRADMLAARREDSES